MYTSLSEVICTSSWAWNGVCTGLFYICIHLLQSYVYIHIQHEQVSQIEHVHVWYIFVRFLFLRLVVRVIQENLSVTCAAPRGQERFMYFRVFSCIFIGSCTFVCVAYTFKTYGAATISTLLKKRSLLCCIHSQHVLGGNTYENLDDPTKTCCIHIEHACTPLFVESRCIVYSCYTGMGWLWLVGYLKP